MTREEILTLIEKGEHSTFEAKRADKELPDSIWATYSAFANTNGGIILLGVTENISTQKLEISGITNPQKYIQNFWSQINNLEKISANILLDSHVSIHTIQAKKIICIEVPRALRQEKPIYLGQNPFTGSYRRNAEGDYHCTPADVKSMLRDQSDISADSMILTECAVSDIVTESLRRYRLRFANLRPSHVWNNIDDHEFLLKIGAVKRSNNVLFPTFAGLLMFANESIIQSIVPDFFLDYRETNASEETRWIDRVYSQSGDWSGNIFDFYFTVIDKILLSTKHPFTLKKLQRIDSLPLHEAIREVVANALIHADYWGKRGVVIEKKTDSLHISNPGVFRISSQEIEQGGISDPRNATVFKMFSLIGVGERAGSGLHTVFYIWNQLHFPQPRIIEGFFPERIHTILDFITIQGSEETNESSEEITKSSEETNESSEEITKSSEEKILQSIRENNAITIRELAYKENISTRAIEKQIQKLKKNGVLTRIGSTKSGKWKIIIG